MDFQWQQKKQDMLIYYDILNTPIVVKKLVYSSSEETH